MFLAFCLFAVTADAAAMSQTHRVSSAGEVEALIEAGKLAAGDLIIWADGIVSDVDLNIEGVDGTESDPITLRAATSGGVVLRGESQFKLGASWWVVEGFHFDGGQDEINSYNTFQFRGNSGAPALHCRLTDCAFTNLKTDEQTSKWVLVYGQTNSIDHCHFSGKDSKGALITVELAYLAADASAEHQISDNYFGDVAPHEGTDNETIRIGSSEDQNKRSGCVVHHNYFVRCNGENEIVSSKSSYNVFEKNTFRQCDGALVLRHGHHATVEGNYFFGDGASDAGGIRVVDSHHTIVNNYLQDLTGTSWNAAFSIMGGKQASGGTDNGYQAVDEITVVHNSILNCQNSIFLNKAKGSRAPAGLIANNLVSSSSGPLVTENLSAAKLKWIGNLMYGAEVQPNLATNTEDPRLSETDGLLRPDANGPAASSAASCGVHVETDIDGQLRPETNGDIGADQVSGTLGEIVSMPLTPSEVGVSFLRGAGLRDLTVTSAIKQTQTTTHSEK